MNSRIEKSASGLPTERTSTVPLKAVWVATFVALSGTWHMGFSIGSVNAAYSPIVSFIKNKYEDRYQENVTSEFVDAMWVTTSAIFPIGGLFGSFCVGPLVTRFGRLKSILYSHITIVLLSGLLGLSKLLGTPELLLIGRFGLGVTSSAMGTGICAMYITEVSPKRFRGIFGGLVGTGISLGIFGANLLGLPSWLANDTRWPVLLAMTGLPSLLFVLFYRTFPESPRELFLELDDQKKATLVLRTMNGTTEIEGIINEMEEEKKMAFSVTRLSAFQVFRSKGLLPSLISASVLGCAQQLSGMNGIAFNLNNAFRTAGLSNDIIPYASIGVTGAVIFLNFVSAIMIEKFGRKFMIILGYSVEAVSLLLITIFIELQHLSNAFPYLTILASIGFFCGFALGVGTVTHVVIPELFDQASRSAGITISSVFLWISFFLCVVSTPYMLASIGGYAFLIFCAFALATAVFTVFKIPETKNKAFHDINKELRNKFFIASST